MFRTFWTVVVLSVGINIIAVLGQAPTVTITRTDPATTSGQYIQAFRDKDVVMDCYVENLPSETTVRWQRTYKCTNGSSCILSISQDMALEDNIHYSIERPTQFTWRLRVRAIQVTDDGKYECYVLTTLNSRTKDERQITVLVPPYLDLQQTSSDMTVTEGEDVDLMCNASGRPDPVIEWTRLGGALLPIGQEKKQGSLLSIKDIQPEHRGVYRCQALNSIGTAQTDIDVNVRFAPIIDVPRSEIYQAVGYRVELQCYAEANPFPHADDAAWSKGSATFTVSSEGYEVRFLQGAFGRLTYELIIFSVQEHDFGDYRCRIKNNIGSTVKMMKLIKTSEPQPSIKLGQIIAGATCVGHSLLLIPAALMLLFLMRTAA